MEAVPFERVDTESSGGAPGFSGLHDEEGSGSDSADCEQVRRVFDCSGCNDDVGVFVARMREQGERIIAGNRPANYGEAIGCGTSDALAGKGADSAVNERRFLPGMIAEILQDRYPDGQLMVDLQGTSDKPLRISRCGWMPTIDCPRK